MLTIALLLAITAGFEFDQIAISINPGTAKGGVFGEPQERQFGLWRRIQDGLEGGIVVALTYDPNDGNTVFAGTQVGAFRSTDGGLTWLPSRNGLPRQTAIREILYHPTVATALFAGTEQHGVFRSVDSGATWKPINPGMEFIGVLSLAVDPNNANRLIAGGTDPTIYITTDGGGSWTPVGLGLSGGGAVTAVAIDPVDGNNVYVGVQAFDSGDQGVFKSTNGGASFSPANAGLDLGFGVPGIEALVVDSNNAGILYAGACGETSGVFKSTDGAQSWSQVDARCSNSLAIDPANSDRVASSEAISLDGGQSWTPSLPAFFPGEPFAEFDDGALSLAIRPGSTTEILAGGDGWGVFRTGDNGAGWSPSHAGLDAGVPSHIEALDADNLITAIDEIGVFTSGDGGQSWISASGVPRDIDFNRFDFAPSDSNVGYLATECRGVYKTTDGGSNWTPANSGIEDECVYAVAVNPQNADNVIIGTTTFDNAAVWISGDGGTTWSKGSLVLGTGDVRVTAVAINPANPNVVYVGVGDPMGAFAQMVYKSLDGGQSYAPTDTAIDAGGDGILALAIDPKTPDTLYAGTGGNGIFKTTNGAVTWSQLAGTDTTAFVFDVIVDPQNPNRLFNSEGELSTDAGATWQAIGPNFPFGFFVTFNPGDPVTVYNSMGDFGLFERRLNESRVPVPEPADTIAGGDQFGHNVVVQGNLVFVGVPGSDDSGTDSGVVYVYRREGERLIEVQKIPVPGSFTASGFGSALAVDGDRLVVGAPGTNGAVAKGNTALQAAIFERLQQGWTFTKAITPGSGTPDDGFGSAVAIEGDTILIGAPRDSEVAAGAGAGYVFSFDGVNVTEMTKETGTTADAAMGTSVAMANGKLAIGAPGGQMGAVSSGVVSLFQSVSGNLMNLGTVAGDGAADGDEFGTAISLDGDTLAVGAPGSDRSAGDSGAVVVFDIQPGNVVQRALIQSDDPDSGSRFGQAVSIGGGMAVVGAPTALTPTGRIGTAFVFAISGSSATQVDRVIPADTTSLDFGRSVALDGTEVLVGAPLSNSEAGSALLVTNNDVLFVGDFE